MIKYCVYCHTNKIDGKKYIGITSQKPEQRWRNGNGYINNRYFYRAIEKYGWHNFYHEILYTNLSKEEAENIEISLIREYESCNPSKGYNIEAGGNGTEKFTEEVRKRLSESLIGHICSEETRAKISKAHKGKPSNKKGIRMTEEQKRKNSESHKGIKPWNTGRPWTDEERAKCNGRPVYCIELERKYRTAHEASRDLNIDFSSICKCVKGKQKTAGRYHWILLELLEPSNG